MVINWNGDNGRLLPLAQINNREESRDAIWEAGILRSSVGHFPSPVLPKRSRPSFYPARELPSPGIVRKHRGPTKLLITIKRSATKDDLLRTVAILFSL